MMTLRDDDYLHSIRSFVDELVFYAKTKKLTLAHTKFNSQLRMARAKRGKTVVLVRHVFHFRNFIRRQREGRLAENARDNLEGENGEQNNCLNEKLDVYT